MGIGLPGSPVGQETLIAAMQPSLDLNTVHDACCAGAVAVPGGGGFAITGAGDWKSGGAAACVGAAAGVGCACSAGGGGQACGAGDELV